METIKIAHTGRAIYFRDWKFGGGEGEKTKVKKPHGRKAVNIVY